MAHKWFRESICPPPLFTKNDSEAKFLARLEELETQGFEIFSAGWVPGVYEIVYRKKD